MYPLKLTVKYFYFWLSLHIFVKCSEWNASCSCYTANLTRTQGVYYHSASEGTPVRDCFAERLQYRK